jgi:hypothetical protein
LTVLGGLCLVTVPPAALIVSVIALFKGANRTAAVVGLTVSGLSLVFFFGFPLLMSLCR